MPKLLCYVTGLDGAASIRIFRQERNFLRRFYKAVDVNSSALLCFISGQRWLGLRIELLGSLIVLTSSVLVISLNQVWELDPGAGKFMMSTSLAVYSRYPNLTSFHL